MIDTPLLDRLRTMVSGVTTTEMPASARRSAAVLLLVDPNDPALPLLFILRKDNLRHHAGQIGFPGGSVDPGDKDIVATALREAQEEVNLDPNNVQVLGTLSSMVTAISDLWLTPVVGLQRKDFDIVADDVEVAEWFRIPLQDLLEAPHEIRTLTRDNISRQVHFYEAHDRIIWGVTGAILHELLTRLGRD